METVFFMSHKRLSPWRAGNVNHTRGWCFGSGVNLASAGAMRVLSQTAALRAEARLLSLAGLILFVIGLPITLGLSLMALSPEGLSPVLPAAAGGPPLMLGYLACHFASRRLVKARDLEEQALAR
jgi:hypothetical protein